MASVITVDDLPAKVHEAVEPSVLGAMVAGANARALRVAPCLVDAVDEGALAEARLVLMGAIQRWSEAGSGALTQRQQTMGPFSQGESFDTRQRAGFNLWPSEISQLQDICKSLDGSTKPTVVFTVSTGRAQTARHLPWCDLMMGGVSCSCGVSIAGVPIYELP